MYSSTYQTSNGTKDARAGSLYTSSQRNIIAQINVYIYTKNRFTCTDASALHRHSTAVAREEDQGFIRLSQLALERYEIKWDIRIQG